MALPDDADLRRLAADLCGHEPAGFSLDTLHEASRLAREDPAALTDRHLQHVACYEPKSVFPLLKKRAVAVEARAEKAFATAQKYAADQARPATATPKPSITAADMEAMTLEQLCETFPTEPVTLGLFGKLHAFVRDMNERNKERNAKLAALETRVLELEATIAARQPVP